MISRASVFESLAELQNIIAKAEYFYETDFTQDEKDYIRYYASHLANTLLEVIKRG